MRKGKTHWNFRVGTKIFKQPVMEGMRDANEIYKEELEDKGTRLFSIVEVYYTNDVSDSFIEPDKNRLDMLNSVKDIKWNLKKMKKALKKPVLDLDNFPNEWKE
jgi:hypothetical protein